MFIMGMKMKIALLICLSLGVIHTIRAQNQSSKGPNVILILADDMGLSDFSSVNGGLSRTPVLDGLRKESAWFNHAYSGSAVCAPARASLLTGKYPHRTGVVSLNMETEPELTSLKKNEVTIADLFLQNGYQTGLVGKWHLGNRTDYHPMKRGFQEFAGFMEGETYYDFKLDINGTFKAFKGPYMTDVLTDYALKFIENHKSEPFFMHLAYKAPHRPLSAPEDIIDYYRKKGFDEKTSKVYAMIEVMDKGIGEVIKKLDDLGIRENTLIIFTSDNGPDPLAGNRFNLNLKGRKYDVTEGGIRVPLLFNWKGKLTPGNVDDLAHFTDMVPTLTNICKLRVSKDVSSSWDGRSLYPLLTAKQNASLPSLRYWQWNRGLPLYTHNAAVREGDWKLVRPAVSKDKVTGESDLKPLLFNIKNDPGETQDISAANTEVYQRMKSLLDAWSKKMEAERLRNADR